MASSDFSPAAKHMLAHGSVSGFSLIINTNRRLLISMTVSQKMFVVQ